MKIFTLRFVFVALSLLVLASSHGARRKPDQVIELFRHGARSPNGDYDPWADLERGQLTSEGMREHYHLGKTLSEKYSHLIETGYDPQDFYAISNDVQRCVESAIVHLTSLFRGKQSTLKGKGHPQESYQRQLIDQISNLIPKDEGSLSPINVDIVDSNTQMIFRGNEPQNCPNLGYWASTNFYSPQAQAGWDTFLDTISEVNSKLPDSQQIYDIGRLVLAYDAIIAAKFDKRRPPGGIEDEVLIKKLELACAYFIYHLEQGQKIQRQLSSFHTLDVVLREMKNFREGKDPKKMVFLSGHDKNLYSVLAAFNIVNNGCLLGNYESYVKTQKLKHSQCYYPYFASNLVFEFYNDPTDPYVQFYYNDVLIPLCNGQEKCSYNKFVQFVEDATGNNDKNEYNRKCTGNPTQVVEELNKPIKPKPVHKDDQKPEGKGNHPKHNEGDNKPNPPPPQKDENHNNPPKRDHDQAEKEHNENPQPQPTPSMEENQNKIENENEKNQSSSSTSEETKNSPTTKTENIKALVENGGGNHSIVSLLIICLVVLSSIVVFARILLNRRKYIQIEEDPDATSLEIA
jgi:hypothetical protein